MSRSLKKVAEDAVAALAIVDDEGGAAWDIFFEELEEHKNYHDIAAWMTKYFNDKRRVG